VQRTPVNINILVNIYNVLNDLSSLTPRLIAVLIEIKKPLLPPGGRNNGLWSLFFC
jgi:hypothetical protein